MGDEGPTLVKAKYGVSVKCPLHLMYRILEDCVERAPEYDTNIARQKSLGRHRDSKRMVRREVWLRKPRLVFRHSIEAQGPRTEIITKEVPARVPTPVEGEEAAAEEPPPPAEGEEGEEGAEPKGPPMEIIEEEIYTAWVKLNLSEMGGVVTELEPTGGFIQFKAIETDEELCEFEVDINIETTTSDPPEGLDAWAESLAKGLKTLAEKMVYLSPNFLGIEAKFSANVFRSVLAKAKKFEFISQHLMRSPSAQSLIRSGTACGSLKDSCPFRSWSAMN